MTNKKLPKNTANLRRIWAAKKQESGLTQTQVAKKLGWTQSAFSQYLNNHVALNPAAILKLGAVLDVHPADIDPEMFNLIKAYQGEEK